jgi:hypothetical protein
VQAASDQHDQIRELIFGVPQDIFDDPTALDTGQGVFDFDANLGKLAIGFLFLGG